MKKLGILCGLMIFANSIAVAQPLNSCDLPEYRQFDFWIGHWDVFDLNGKKLGENRVKKILKGCVIQENWTGVGGNVGQSYNIYDRSTSSWHQTWVDNNGMLLQLDGGLEKNVMVLTGVSYSVKGEMLNRIKWTPKTDKGKFTIHQEWSYSMNGGKTWKEVFQGIYKKR